MSVVIALKFQGDVATTVAEAISSPEQEARHER
jgi:hypothetical protein